MNPTAIFSKTGKGVQEASGKTSHLSRADRAVLKEIDGKTNHGTIAAKFEKIPADKFDALIQQFDKDGYVREVSSGAQPAAAPTARSMPPTKAAPPPTGGDGDDMDFTQAIKVPSRAPAAPAGPKPPPLDLAAASRAEAERKGKEQQAFDYKARQEAELKAKAEAEAKARLAAEAKLRAEADARAKAELEAKARAASGAKALAEADAKVKAAREAAIRMATEVKAKAEAEGKAKADAAEGREREALERARRESEEKAKLEAELKGKLEEERKAREEAERRANEATERARKEMEEKAKRDAEEMRQRLEEEMKAKLEAERKAREEEDRKRREEDDRRRAEEDRKRREEDERRRKEEEERRAKEAEERRVREEEDRKRRKEEEERRAKEDAERKARAEEDRKRREEEDRKRAEEDKRRKEDAERRAKEDADRRAKEDADRRAKEDADRRAKEDADRRAKDDADRRAREDADRRAREESEAKARAASSSASIPTIPPVAATPSPPPPPPAAASGGGIADSLLADLESFGQREEEEQKAKEEAERKAKEEAARKAKEAAERQAKEEAERKAKEEADRKRREEEDRRAQEEADQRAREEEERQKEEEAERKRKAKESLATKEAERKAAQRAAASKGAGKDIDDIEVTNEDLDMDDIKKDEKALAASARKQAQEQAPAIAVANVRRPRKWGKPAALVLFVLLVGGIGVLHVMPLSTTEYETAATGAMGVPVKISSARLSVITGIEVKLEGVTIGDAVRIRTVRGFPEIGSLFGAKKSFTRIELEGATLSQAQLGDAVLGKVAGENFRVGRIAIKQAKLDGPLSLPPLDIDAVVAGDGSVQSVSLRGGDKLSVQLSPKGTDIGFEIAAGSLALPFAPALSLSDFEMKGTANRAGVTASEFSGRAFDGTIFGSAKIRWGSTWVVDGEVKARGVKVAVLAPALVSEGKAEGRAAYSMSGSNPATLFEGARMQGEFKIEKGVLGSFDLTRALQTGGAQSGGRTEFSELTGQALYDKGVVRISSVAITAGAMNANATLDIDASGAIAGRVVADVKTPNQTLRATLNVSGKIQDPVIRK